MPTEVLQNVYRIADRLSEPDITAEAIAASLGTPRKRILSQIEVDPSDAHFTSITVVHKFESPVPNHVRLMLAEPVELDAVVDFFGSPLHELDTTTNPPTMQFRVDTNHAEHVIRLVAYVQDQQVQTIELVRNIRPR
jgi:hypothetical protein